MDFVSAGDADTIGVENESFGALGTVSGTVHVDSDIANLIGEGLNEAVSAVGTTTHTVGDSRLWASAVVETAVIDLKIAIFVGSIELSVVALSNDGGGEGTSRVGRSGAGLTSGDVPGSTNTLDSDFPVVLFFVLRIKGVGYLDNQV